MKTPLNLARAAACLLLAAAGTHAYAQQAIQAAADPQASVPATRYQSALGKGAGPAPETSPDANWVASNQTVAATDSMALTMKPMAGQAADPHAGHAMPPAQSADPHAGHAGMHGMQGMGMNMDKKDGPAMCAPGSGSQAMQCMSGDKAGDKAGEGKMSCCQSCCKDKMKKGKESP
ncbi:hypothetical protein ACI48D_12270 [Massilia sp. LXY-6]|uniref:hypothetical protein n=1 Tax=Massilia sp. LXY-6 TaxID=3379823 RepID=UPI003EDFF30C